MAEVTREELIALCEAALVPESEWRNRDSAGAQRQIGEAWALLRAGCPYRILPGTDDDTIWIEIDFKGFDWFELGRLEVKTFYIPTRARLARANGGDWY